MLPKTIGVNCDQKHKHDGSNNSVAYRGEGSGLADVDQTLLRRMEPRGRFFLEAPPPRTMC